MSVFKKAALLTGLLQLINASASDKRLTALTNDVAGINHVHNGEPRRRRLEEMVDLRRMRPLGHVDRLETCVIAYFENVGESGTINSTFINIDKRS